MERWLTKAGLYVRESQMREPFMTEKFDLLYRDELLGTVLTDQTDFPSSSGQINFNTVTLEKDKDLQEYIQFSMKSSDEVIRQSGGYYQFRSGEKVKYQSIINSPRWYVIAKDGTRTRILAP